MVSIKTGNLERDTVPSLNFINHPTMLTDTAHNFFTHDNKFHVHTYRDYYKAVPSAPHQPQKSQHIKMKQELIPLLL